MTALDAQAFLDGASVASAVFALQPDYRAVLIVADGIAPLPSDEHSAALLQSAGETARTLQQGTTLTALPHVAAWREAYKHFTKPNKFRNSLEALMRRPPPSINRLTDTYNAISIKYQIPLGGEDVAKYRGSPRLVVAEGTEEFETKAGGEVVKECAERGEVVWMDDVGVTCRRWNWRQGPRTALDEKTTTAVFICDALGAMSDGELKEATDELVKELKRMGPDVRVWQRTIKKS